MIKKKRWGRSQTRSWVMRSRRKREEEKGAAEETEEEKEEEMGKKKNRRTHTYTHKNETWISLKERKNVDRAMTQNSTRSREPLCAFFLFSSS